MQSGRIEVDPFGHVNVRTPESSVKRGEILQRPEDRAPERGPVIDPLRCALRAGHRDRVRPDDVEAGASR